MRSRTPTVLGAALATAALAADQFLKSWAHSWVAGHGDLHLFPGFDIIATSNTGVAFSLAQGFAPSLLIAVGIALSMLFCVWLVRTRSLVHAAGLGLAIGGALGNVVDRLRFGSVRDFIDLYWQRHHWPAFNLADAVIVTGLALLILFPAVPAGRERRPDRAAERQGTRSGRRG